MQFILRGVARECCVELISADEKKGSERLSGTRSIEARIEKDGLP
jgi:hypothetical protein